MNEMLAAALRYAALGIAIFQCEASDKKPCGALVLPDKDHNRKFIKGTGGLKKATTDPAIITEWWTSRPDAMIGAPTGAVNGFWAADPDVPKQVARGQLGEMMPDEMRAWISLIDKHGGIDPTIEVTSPTGGKHVYFRYDPKFPVTNSEGALHGLGINIRGDGGYVILPPSLRSDGKAYVANRTFDRVAIADATPWLYDLIRAKRERASKSPNGHAGDAGGRFQNTEENADTLRGALFFIPADDREIWLRVGLALNTLMPCWGDLARTIWDQWSERSSKFDPVDQENTWQGFDPLRADGVTVATIFYEAEIRGWRRRSQVNQKAKSNGESSAGEDADEPESAEIIDLEIARLAKLRQVDYERVRKDEAAKLGIRASILDRLVARERPSDGSGSQSRNHGQNQSTALVSWTTSRGQFANTLFLTPRMPMRLPFGPSTPTALTLSLSRRDWRSRRRCRGVAKQP